MLKKILPSVLLFVALMTGVSAQDLFSTETIDCPPYVDYENILEGEVEGETYECGVVVVPENYFAIDGRHFELVYLKLFATGDSPAAEPLVYLSGGPGGSALHEFNPSQPLWENLQLIRQGRDVVTYDQRGTGLSDALLCGPFDAAIGATLDMLPEETAQTVQELEESSHAVTLNYAVCFGAYMEAGSDLRQSNSNNSARDIASLMTALGYDQYNLMGTSYGTKLSQVAAKLTPERVRSVVLDGVTPITGAPIADHARETSQQWEQIIALCTDNDACNAAYPNLAERFGAVLDELEENPLIFDEPIVLSGYESLPAISFELQGGASLFEIDRIDAEFFINVGDALNVVDVWNQLAGFQAVIPEYQYSDLTFLDEIPLLIQAVEARDEDLIRSIFEHDGQTAAEIFTGLVPQQTAIEDEGTVISELENPYVAKSLTTLLGIANEITANPVTPEEQWLSLSLDYFTNRALTEEDNTAVVVDMIELLLIPIHGISPQEYIDYANENLPEHLAEEANALIAEMTPVQLRNIRFNIFEISAAMSITGESVSGLHRTVLYSVNCNEATAFHNLADAQRFREDTSYPQLSVMGDEEFNLFKVVCSFMPATILDQTFIEPFNSDIPALILQGKLDPQTPLDGALEAAEFFNSSVVALFDTEGHVVSGKIIGCPGMIAVEFLDDPTGDVDTSCADDYTVEFDLSEGNSPEEHTTEVIDCPSHVDYELFFETEVEGETYECGVVVVPMNYDDPEGQQIELVYLRLFATGDIVAPEPLIYLSGGPGGSALAELRPGSNISLNLSVSRQVMDVIAFDQRGTGLSYPLFCGPFEAAIGAALDVLPEDVAQSVIEIEDQSVQSTVLNYAVCFTGYESVGVDLAQWNSINSAHDIASVATALGYDQYNLMGTSYGTKLAQVAIRETPERVRTVVLDGVTPITSAVMAGNSVEAAEQYVRIFELCEADEDCNVAFPNLEQRFYAVLEDLAANPIELDKPIIPSGFNAIMLTQAAAQPLLTIETIDWTFFSHLGETLNKWPNLFHLADFVKNHPDWTIETTSYLDEVPLMIQALEQRDVEQFRSILEQEGSTGIEWIEQSAAAHTEQVEDENAVRVELENPFVAQSLTTLLGIANDMTASPSSPDVEWLRISLDSLTERVQAGEDTTPIVIDMIDMLLIPMQGLGAQVYIDYANENLPEALASEANALIEGMTPTQIRELRFTIYQIGAVMSFESESLLGVHQPVLYAVNCNESMAFRTQDDVDAAVAAAAFPQMNVFGENTWNLYKTICSFLPPTIIDPSFIEPIDGGDIPALILQGKLDTHTPMSGALEVATYFDSSTVVLFDTEGHVVSGLSYFCPGIIAATFIDDPTGDVDTSCTADYSVTFALPE